MNLASMIIILICSVDFMTTEGLFISLDQGLDTELGLVPSPTKG